MSIEKPHIELGERLKLLKFEWKLTQREMAKKLGIAISTYQYYERGERDIPSTLLIKLTSFGVNPKWLLIGDGDMFDSSEPISEAKSLELLKGVDDAVVIGERIKRRRNYIGMSSNLFAEKMKISPQVLKKYEAGILPSRKFLARIADALNCSVAWLLTGKGAVLGKPDYLPESLTYVNNGNDLEHDGTPTDTEVEKKATVGNAIRVYNNVLKRTGLELDPEGQEKLFQLIQEMLEDSATNEAEDKLVDSISIANHKVKGT